MNARERILVMAIIAYVAGIVMTLVVGYDSRRIVAGTPIAIQQATTTQSFAYMAVILIGIIAMATIFTWRRDALKRIFSKVFGLWAAYYVFAGVFIIILYGGMALRAPVLPIEIGSILGGILAAVLWFNLKGYHNLFAIIISIGTIAILATSFSLLWILAIFEFLSIWDLIAVFKLKFMQELAGMAINQQGKKPFPLFIYSGSLSSMEHKLQGKPQKGASVALLGLGDIIIPGAFLGALALSMPARVPLAIIAIFVALDANMWLAKHYKKAIPALPLMFLAALLMIL